MVKPITWVSKQSEMSSGNFPSTQHDSKIVKANLSQKGNSYVWRFEVGEAGCEIKNLHIVEQKARMSPHINEHAQVAWNINEEANWYKKLVSDSSSDDSPPEPAPPQRRNKLEIGKLLSSQKDKLSWNC